jgi:O-succinylbenzoic acid--CoA ligase
VVIATSGSTGEPKLVALSAAALRASAKATADRLGGPARWLLALPAEHVAGVQVILRAHLAGAPPVVQDLRPGFRVDDFTAATAALGDGRRYTSLVPTQLLRVLDAGGPALDALRSYDAILVGGAALEPGLRSRAVDAGARIVTTYGMSETCGGCVYDGVPLDGVVVDLDPDGRVLLGGPTLAEGYLGRPEETADTFVGGRFRTGDLGRFADGRLEILGRADDVIITGGEKIAPAAVERVLAAQPGVRAVCVVGVPDPEWGQVVAAAVVRGADAAEGWVEPLRAAVRSELGRAAVPRRVIALPEIPVRGIGKPDRRAVAHLVTIDDGVIHSPG